MTPRTPVTACIITFNEERSLPEALRSVGFADEIIVVDSHSKDKTRAIAAAFSAARSDGTVVRPRVIERDWPGHVEQKNFAIDQAANDWVLCVDADERVSPELRQEVEEALARESPGVSGYTMPRKNFYLGRWVLHGGWYPDRKLRLFRRSLGKWGGTNPHDHVRVQGKVGRLRGDLHHYSYQSLADHLRTINSFTDIAAREKLKKGVRFPVPRMILQPPFKFFKMFFLKQGFREGAVGLIMATMGSLYVFLKYAKLWELQNGEWKDAPLPPARLPPTRMG
jgi:glycosyltransferase involved in cell wall biosynthesis